MIVQANCGNCDNYDDCVILLGDGVQVAICKKCLEFALTQFKSATAKASC